MRLSSNGRVRYRASIVPSSIPPGAPPHAQAAYLLARVGRDHARRFAASVGALGLRPKHFAVLNAVALADGASQQELGRRLDLDPSGLVSAIDELERMSLVERRRDDADRRRYAVRLTDEGAATLTRARRLVAERARELLAPLSDGDVATLVGLLARVAAADQSPGGVPPPVSGSPIRSPKRSSSSGTVSGRISKP